MDLVQATALERIELIAKFVGLGLSNEREKQIALLMIADLAADVREKHFTHIKKPPMFGGGRSSCDISGQNI